MTQFSLTIASLLVMALTKFLDWAGIQFAPADLDGFVKTIIYIITGIGIWRGRVRIGDITWWGKRIKPQ